MARPLRVDVPDGLYHVMARGIDRRTIFMDDRDRWHFVDLLAVLPERFRVVVHAYVCMDSHYHLILQTPDANLSQAMHWFNVSYSAWFNARHNRVGPLFQGRFKSVGIENMSWAYELSLYVHLNPLRIKALGLSKRDRAGARLGQGKAPSDEVLKERLKRLRAFRWSSYRAYAGYTPVPDWLEGDAILAYASKQPARRIAAYRRTVRERLTEGADPDKLDALRDRVAIGSAVFVARVKQGLAEIGRETEGKRVLRRRITFSEVSEVLTAVHGAGWEEVLPRYGDPVKWLVLRVARRYTGMTLAELGEVAGGMDYAAVGMALRRLARTLPDTPDLQQLEARMVKMLDVKT
jgi:putative transposase